ncbi:cyclic pyranopterin monophosphate synthase MoaC [Hymenobacter sp. PAMC 26628]|uniref:cyclic pyranopterin monophosphate synthase MoaC n=1 Tax=Hymenobacter sp. PAMC 26628 TaxID=1484118 RepID=UPI0007700CDA|nr:cyclic pyranopterin monophosphate synthase MoaC [Hymenobacter sp. PAMC 26628]AMJ64071.1 cyclic pyranopterin monophosphate synthase accessory protein [Hymenobacter sp. PAMC 26628]
MLSDKFTHVNAANQPTMVDVGAKAPTRRLARAHCRVVLGPELLGRVRAGELPSHKGPVIHTAILAGIMGAKKTADLIPLCHPLGLDDCQITIEPDGPDALRVVCTAVVTGRTGVEMEALTGASVAALTIYDMCKAFSHDITITGVQLIEKTGGKRDFLRPEKA